MNRNHRSAGALALAVLAAALGAGGAPGQEKRKPLDYPDSISFRGGRTTGQSGPFTTHLGAVGKDKRGRTVARFALFNIHGLGLPCNSLQFPDLREGDLVPVRGEVYRVSRVSGGDLPSMALDKLPVDKRPRGIAPARDSFTVPLQGGDRGHGETGYKSGEILYVRVLEAKGPADEKGKPTALMQFQDRKMEGEESLPEAWVVPGDVVLFSSHAHRVRNVVPPDEKTRLIGWVEFDPEAVAEKDLVAKKTPFVRPARPKKE